MLQEHQQAFQDHLVIYGWPKAIAASAISWSGGLVAAVTEIPWMGLLMAAFGIIPPLLKVIFDHRLRKSAMQEKSMLEWNARLTEEREMNFQRARRAEDLNDSLVEELLVVREASDNLIKELTSEREVNCTISDRLDGIEEELKDLKENHGKEKNP